MESHAEELGWVEWWELRDGRMEKHGGGLGSAREVDEMMTMIMERMCLRQYMEWNGMR